MTPEQANISHIIFRYKNWLLSGIYPKEHYVTEKSWRDEINQKVKELESKLKQNGTN